MATLATWDDWLDLAAGRRRTTDWIDAFAVGQHHPGKQVWTAAEIDSILSNWHLNHGDRHRPPLGLLPNRLGHKEQLLWLADDSQPKVGEVADVRKSPDDGRLQIRLNAPPKVALAVRLGLFDNCSAELYDEPPPGCLGQGPMLKRVALLGFAPPAVKNKGGLYRREPPGRRPPLRTWVEKESGRTFVFSEGAAMAQGASDLEQSADQLITAQPVTLTAEIVAELSPDVKAKILATLAPGGGDTGATPPPPAEMQDADTPMAPDGGAMSRDQKVQMILQMAGGQYTQDQLDAMSDEEIDALYNQVVGGGGGTNMSDPVKPAVPAHQFAEQLAATRRELARDRSERERDRREREAERQARQTRLAAERKQAVHTFCEQLVAERFLTPAHVGTPEQPGPTRKRLTRAAENLTFAEGKTALEAEVETVKAEMRDARGRPMFAGTFAEKMPADLGAGGAAAPMTPERRAQLLSHTRLGRTILRDERARKN